MTRTIIKATTVVIAPFVSLMIHAQSNNYTKEWAEIDTLLQQQLPKSVLPKVEVIYKSALAEKNYEQLIKAIIYQLNCIGILEEKDIGTNRIFNTLKKDAERLPQPAKSVVYSMIGQMYGEYYKQNAGMINNRTTTPLEVEDVCTWDGRELIEEALKYYRLSLQEAIMLQNVPIERYHDILLHDEDVSYQPVLYDLLANRALSFYADPLIQSVFSQKDFVANNPDYFTDAQNFINLNIQSDDSLSACYLSLKTYQELLRFHLNRSGFGNMSVKKDSAIEALIHADIRRLSYLYVTDHCDDKVQLFEEALINLSNTYQLYDQNSFVLLKLADFYLNRGEQRNWHQKDDPKSGYRKAYEICERIEKAYPNQSSEQVEAMKACIINREMYMQTEGVQLPGQPFLALLHFRNVETLHKTVFRLSEEEAFMYHYNYSYRNYRQENANFLKSLKTIVMQEVIRLPSNLDHLYQTTTIKMPSLEAGFYLCILSDTPDFLDDSLSVMTIAMVQVTSLMTQDRSVDNAVTVLVTDRKTGKPIADAIITAYRDNKIITTFTSNKDGIASGRNPNSSYYRVNAGNRQLIVFRTFHGLSNFKERQNLAVVFTDRSIYRPGQTIYFKAILFQRTVDKEDVLITSKTVNVRFLDTNSKVITKQKLITNDFGSINGSFTIPQGLLNGNMGIQIEGYNTEYIRVEAYKRPTFEVKFNPVTENYSLNEKIKVIAGVKALAGYSIDNAQVQYRVERKERFRNFSRGDLSTHEISSGMLKTDENGLVTIEFMAFAGDVANDDLFYTYSITVDVTDLNGETRSASTTVCIGDNPLLLDTNLPQYVLAGKTDHFTINTTNLNGVFTPASVQVEIISLKSPEKILRRNLWPRSIDLQVIPEDEFRKDFPLDMYGDDLNPQKFEAIETIAGYTMHTSENQKPDLSALKHSGYYKVKLSARDQKGNHVDDVRYFYFISENPEKIASMDQWLTVVKENGEPGEQAEFLIAGGEDDSYVFCELIHQSRIVESKWIRTSTKPLKVTFPIIKEHQGGFSIRFNMVQNNRLYQTIRHIAVPFSNKRLDVKLTTFRNQLSPGEHETWTMLVTDKQGKKESAEIVASLYDASLDAFSWHNWDFDVKYRRSSYSPFFIWNEAPIHHFAISSAFYTPVYESSFSLNKFYANINWFNRTYQMALRGIPPFNLHSHDIAVMENASQYDGLSYVYMNTNKPLENQTVVTDTKYNAANIGMPLDKPPTFNLTTVATRTNFNETAFFYPKLRTNEQGEALIEFTMPEALTRWKLLSFAHTQDFKTGSYTNELITQKQVAISANPPRFFRENDVIELTAKVNNLTETNLNGQALLRLYDAVTMEPVDAIIKSDKTVSFNVKTGESTGLRWRLVIPKGIQAITYRLTAQAGTHTDGEEKTVPVLTNSMIVTETLPFSIRAGKTKSFTLDKLANNQSKTLQHHSLTLEYTSAPAWYAVQALPYIMEYPYECAEQTFSRYYANTLATAVVNKTPRIKQIFDLWNTLDSKALLSNLEKNQELKQVMLEETPWVLHAKNESERKKRIGLLFDFNRMSNEMNRAFNQLKKVQNDDGGFPWFAGNPSNRYITQHIIIDFHV